ncbi:MAG: transcriptional regulator with XRE-family HTH domain [Bacteroidia bacterium]|jgi:transcriptional regulator with XRE-family HTH domain
MSDIAHKEWTKMSDKALLKTIGNYIQAQRLNQNKTQALVANEASISRSTLSLLERGEKVRMDSFIRVLRVLDLLHIMNAFTIQDEISPLEYAKLKKKKRKQASPTKPNNTNSDNDDLGW